MTALSPASTGLGGVLLLCIACQQPADSAAPTGELKYRATPTGYVMVLRQGDDLFRQLERLATTEQIPGASFSGFGFVHATFGFFDAKKRAFEPREFRDVELASMNGSMGWKGSQPSIHAHGVVSDRTFDAFGGHLLKLEVGTGSLEVTIVRHDQRLVRARDEALGADVLGFD